MTGHPFLFLLQTFESSIAFIFGGTMFFQEQHSETLFSIASFLHQKPNSDELCEFLAINVCPTGELSRIYVGRLDNDAVIRTENAFGYSLDSNVMSITTNLDLDRPMPDAVRKKKVIVLNKDKVLQNYRDYEPLDPRSPWSSTVVIPNVSNYVFVFGLQCSIEQEEYALLYFRLVGALLSFYDFEEARTRQIARDKTTSRLQGRSHLVKKGQPLTERQELIVDLIKKSKTNVQIAEMLGYSESLIRQETIIIYQKLGIEGRRELLRNV
jgi:DNA-binding CsgD family transcriptional regulator